MFEIFFQSLIIGYSGAVMPGSLLSYTLNKSMKSGIKAGLLVSLGHSIVELLLVFLLFFGMGKYLDTQIAHLIIGFAGGILLIIFGIMSLRNIFLKKTDITIEHDKKNKSGTLILGGALVSISNPYFIVWWAIVGLSLLTNAYAEFGFLGVTLFYFGHILSDFTWYSFVSAVAGKTGKFINQKVYNIIMGILALSLLAFGTSFIVSSITLLKDNM